MRSFILLIFLSSLMLTGCGGEDVSSSSAVVKSGPVIASAVNVVP